MTGSARNAEPAKINSSQSKSSKLWPLKNKNLILIIQIIKLSVWLGNKLMKKAKTLSHLFMVWFLRVIIICAFAPIVQNLYADGKYSPVEAYKIPPDIPTQRAILVYRDGFEKLTIESALNGQGQEFGWVIPLPSKPIQFEKASPGLIKTLSLAIQPKIIHDLVKSIMPFCAITVIITLGCLMSITETPKTRAERFLVFLLMTFIFSCFLFMQPLSAARTAGIKATDIIGVKVHGVQEIGSYELATLEADDANALDKWLSSNGFAGLMDKDIPVISDYIINGWYFVAAKLRREASGYSLPHPLTMSFASEIPIYPIRLTSTLGDNLYLEIFVIAEKQAKCSKLALEVSDEYKFKKNARRYFSSEIFLPGFLGKTYSQDIGHPDAKEHLWNGCVVSKLSGTLTPNDMAEDIILELKLSKPYQKYYFSRMGAGETGLIASLIAWCLLFTILIAVFGSKGKKGNKWKALFNITIFTLSVSLLVGAVAYAVLPKVDVQAISFVRMIMFDGRLVQEGFEIAEKYDYFEKLNVGETIQLVDDYFVSKDTKNIYTGEKIKCEDSPGNYIVFKDERGIILRVYSKEGYPYDCVLTSKPTK